jgi:hypothetical protein
VLEKVNDHTMLSDGAYHIGKILVQIYIPALSSLYFVFGLIFDLPAVEQVVGSLAILALFLGVCLGLSSKQYDTSEAAYDGKVVVETNGAGKKMFSLELDGDPAEIEQKNAVSFKVANQRKPLSHLSKSQTKHRI